MKHFDCDSILGNDLTEIKLPTCRTVRAERPVCPKVVGAGGGGGGGGGFVNWCAK